MRVNWIKNERLLAVPNVLRHEQLFVCIIPSVAFSDLSIPRIFKGYLKRIKMQSGVCCAVLSHAKWKWTN